MVDVPGGAGGEVKQQQVEMEEAGIVAAGADKLAAVDGATMEQVQVTICISKLHCPLCSFPLKPPIFQSLLRPALRQPVLRLRLQRLLRPQPRARRLPPLDQDCYDAYGCRAIIAYCDSNDHCRVCPYAPCSCPERQRGRCSFVGSPPMLVEHIAAKHPDGSGTPRVAAVRYGQETKLALTAARRPKAAAAQYTCKLALELPSGGGEEEEGGVVVMEFKVRSSALPGGTPAKDQRASLKLHQKLEPGDMLALTVRIDRLIQPVGAAAAAGESTATGQIDGVVSSRHTIELATRSNLNSRGE
ncbi:unnamed protein product [Urochloa decumbens]|uniref:SIAH-type domain-containing protein n=1 Tax=Urochloa decumbens TaxID=240449 RepID=A0ABC9AFG3_9POAL